MSRCGATNTNIAITEDQKALYCGQYILPHFPQLHTVFIIARGFENKAEVRNLFYSFIGLYETTLARQDRGGIEFWDEVSARIFCRCIVDADWVAQLSALSDNINHYNTIHHFDFYLLNFIQLNT